MAKKPIVKTNNSRSESDENENNATEVPKKIDVYITPEEWASISAAMQREHFKVKGPWVLSKVLTWIQNDRRQEDRIDSIESEIQVLSDHSRDILTELSWIKETVANIQQRLKTPTEIDRDC